MLILCQIIKLTRPAEKQQCYNQMKTVSHLFRLFDSKVLWYMPYSKCFVLTSGRVNCYIKFGWDQYLIDPDRGANCLKKLTSILPTRSLSYNLIRSLPKYDDPQWTTRLHELLYLKPHSAQCIVIWLIVKYLLKKLII